MKFRPLTLKILSGAGLLLMISCSTIKAQVNSIHSKDNGFIPGGEKDGPTVSLSYNDTVSVPSFTDFSIPVIMQTGYEISAISLGFYYPQEYIEITGMELADSTQGFSYSAVDGLFRMAWSDVAPINIMDQDTVMILKMKSSDISLLTGTIEFGLYELSEFADQSANIIEGVVLEIPEIQYQAPDPGDSLLFVYPNPFNDFTIINFYLETDSKVKISICNLAGMKLMQLPDADYTGGIHQVNLFALDFSKGIYLLKFEVINEEQSSSKLIKIMSIR